MVIIERNGKVNPTSLQGVDPALSPDGAWIVAGKVAQEFDQGMLQIAPRSGGPAHALSTTPGSRLIGWLGGRVVYSVKDTLYSVSTSGTDARLLTRGPSGSTLMEVGDSPIMSPDGQVLFVWVFKGPVLLLNGDQLHDPPPDVLTPVGLYWSGPHEYLALTQANELVGVDGVTGQIDRHTGITFPQAGQAISYPWVAWIDRNLAQPETGQPLHALNLQTGADVLLGPMPIEGKIVSLGMGGHFLLLSEGQVYSVSVPA